MPSVLAKSIFELIHSIDHPGTRQTKINISKYFVWENMDKEIEKMVAACLSCQFMPKIQGQIKTPLQSFPLPNARFDHVHLDIVGPLPTVRGGFKYLFTLVDRYSRFPMAIPLRSATTSAIINSMVDKWISIFGLPQTLTTDQGSIFMSNSFKQFLCKYQISHVYTTAYHPQSNGMVERFHR